MTDDSVEAPQYKTDPESPSDSGIKKKITAGPAASGIFLLGFVAETGLTTVKEIVFPSQSEARALQIQENLDAKAASIEALSQSIQERLKAAEDENGLAKDTQQLLAAIDDLRPDIYAAADLSRSTVTRLITAKGNAITTTGASTISEFDLRVNHGATVCRQGYTFGFSIGSFANVINGSLSGSGKSTGKLMNPGESISLNDPSGGVVAVNYRGFSDEQNGLYGFDVDCG